MSDAVEISFRTDLADLESGAAKAVSLLRDAAAQMAAAFVPDPREAALAQRIADEKIRIAERAGREEIAAESDKNNFLLRMGEESLDAWKAHAVELETARYEIALQGVKSREAADESSRLALARDQAEEEGLAASHADRLAAIDRQYREKQRQQDQTELQDFTRTKTDALNAALAKLDAEFRAHEISAQERRDLEIGLTDTVQAEVLDRFDIEHAGLAKGTQAYAQAMKERQALVDQFAKHVETADNQLETEEARKWHQLGQSIDSSLNSAFDDLVFHGITFKQFMGEVAEGVLEAFLHMGEQILENWIETQIAQMFITRASASATALGQITDNAAVAASGAAAATAQIPYVGPALAPAAAAATFADTMGWASALAFDVGAWEIPGDMRAILHRGEMVVPADFASGLRANGGGLGGEQRFHVESTFNHYGGGEWKAEDHARDLIRVLKNQLRLGVR